MSENTNAASVAAESAYSAPRVVVLGDVMKLTASGTGTSKEGSGSTLPELEKKP
jgi:hypothetical protein